MTALRSRSTQAADSARIPDVEVIHAAVPGRWRLRIRRLRGKSTLTGAVEQRFRLIPGVRAATGNVHSASVLLSFDGTLSPDALREQIEHALSEVLGSPEHLSGIPTVVGILPLREASLPEVLGAVGRLISKLVPATNVAARAPSEQVEIEPVRGTRAVAIEPLGDASGSVRWHTLGFLEVLVQLRSERDGLSAQEVLERQRKHGPNALPLPPRRSKLAILASQLESVPVAMLGVSALLSVATGGLADAAAILAVVIVNASIGFVTESNAERIISSLGGTAHPDVDVIRAGERSSVPVEAIVPGDILVLLSGTFVPADARLLEADGLIIDESALTGESVPVHKRATTLTDPGIPLADRVNMAFRGTLVTGGSGLGIVIATGVRTQIGQVQSLVGSVTERETPLQGQLRQLGLQVAVVAGSVCAGVLGLGLLRGYPLLRMLNTSVSLAVAAIPEGLPTVAITTLTLGIHRMAARKVLVRELSAVETLGAIQVMCLDKTGTITVNRMSAVAVFAGMRDFEIHAPSPHPTASPGPTDSADFDELLRVAVLCNEAQIETRAGVDLLQGSPTEAALVQLALDRGVDARGLRQSCSLLATQYRSEARSYMATLHQRESEAPRRELTMTSGAPELDDEEPFLVSVKGRSSEVLGMCRYHLQNGHVAELTVRDRLNIETASERMAGQALRVLGFACARWSRERASAGAFTLEGAQDLIWLGLVGMSDPPREGMADILRRFHAAGVKTVMITGDQSATAYAIGKAIGLSSDGPLEILDSTELDRLPPEALRSLAQRTHIFSRVSPAHKLQIVQALQSAGLTVAMTGDGINDSPALKAADVGVAMGGSGTSAAREVADVILEDDNLATMITGIEQGRTIYDDIKKAVHFILSTNSSEILLTTLGIALGTGETLTPMQLLWINLISDIFPELALAVQPPEADLLRRPPRDPARPMFTRTDFARLAVEGGVLTSGPLLAHAYGRLRYGTGPRAGTLAFTVLAITQLLHVVSSRSEQHTTFDRDPMAPNQYVPLALGGGLALQMLTILVPGLRRILGVAPLGLLDWGVVGMTAVGPLLVNESVKVLLRDATAAQLH